MGTTQSVISRLEEGGGAKNRLDTLARVAEALDRHLIVSFPEKVPARIDFWKVVNVTSQRLLCDSKDFTVVSVHEEVWLRRSSSPGLGVMIGDFYGDCEAGVIDSDHAWCLMVGEGLIAYSLSAPWTPFRRHVDCSQWWEFGRSGHSGNGEGTLWFEAPIAIGVGRFTVMGEAGGVFVVDAVARSIQPV